MTRTQHLFPTKNWNYAYEAGLTALANLCFVGVSHTSYKCEVGTIIIMIISIQNIMGFYYRTSAYFLNTCSSLKFRLKWLYIWHVYHYKHSEINSFTRVNSKIKGNIKSNLLLEPIKIYNVYNPLFQYLAATVKRYVNIPNSTAKVTKFSYWKQPYQRLIIM